MTDAPLSPEHEDIALAGEYALRLLTPDEEKAVIERMRDDPAFASLVTGWESHFATIAEDIEGVEPSQVLKSSLMQRAFQTPNAPSFWDRFRLWGWAMATAVVLIGAVALSWTLWPSEEPTYMAEIVAEDGSIAVTASYFKESKDVLVEVTAGAAPDGRVLQVWGILERQTPVPIGVIPANGKGRFEVPPELVGKFAGLICAISEEPPGGSPTGVPTGQVLATAPLRPV